MATLLLTRVGVAAGVGIEAVLRGGQVKTYNSLISYVGKDAVNGSLGNELEGRRREERQPNQRVH
eukprot:scaffold25859_cov25-Tisochrysis_lutea.AAC.2